MNRLLWLAFAALFMSSCRDKFSSDASGVFESDEVIVSAEQTGKILSFDVNEGDKIERGKKVGQIDVSSDQLKKAQVEASIRALNEKTNTAAPQVNLTKNSWPYRKRSWSNNCMRKKELKTS